MAMNKLSFSGHDTFYCRHFWLKKGVDYCLSNKKFTDSSAVIDLGVGKNMVAAIRFWLRAFGLLILDEQKSTEVLSPLATLIFADDGLDPYVEDKGTLWLLHYYLVKTERASIYSLLFNFFRKEQITFTKEQFFQFLVRTCISQDYTYNGNTLQKDIVVLLRNYMTPTIASKNIEDDFSTLLMDLNLLSVKTTKKQQNAAKTYYYIANKSRSDLPVEILLFIILDHPDYIGSSSLSFRHLLNDKNSIGSIFALSPNGLQDKIIEMTERFPFLVYADDAGIRELQFKEKPDKWSLLKKYYK